MNSWQRHAMKSRTKLDRGCHGKRWIPPLASALWPCAHCQPQRSPTFPAKGSVSQMEPCLQIMKQSSQGSQGTKFWNSSKKRPDWITSQHAAWCLPSMDSIVYALTVCGMPLVSWTGPAATAHCQTLHGTSEPMQWWLQAGKSKLEYTLKMCMFLNPSHILKEGNRIKSVIQKLNTGEKIVEHGWAHRNIISACFGALSFGIMPFLKTIPDKMLVAI